MKKLIVRAALESDLEEIRKLNNELFVVEHAKFDSSLDLAWPSSAAGTKYYRDAIASGGAFVALDESSVVGYVIGAVSSPVPYRVNPRVVELENMYVLPAYRSKGAGRQLIRAFKSWAATKSPDTLLVVVSAPNIRAQSFYQKNGFHVAALMMEINPKNHRRKTKVRV